MHLRKCVNVKSMFEKSSVSCNADLNKLHASIAHHALKCHHAIFNNKSPLTFVGANE